MSSSINKVAYKPLGISPSKDVGDENDFECDMDDEVSLYGQATSHHFKYPATIYSNLVNVINLRCLRTLLYLVAIILFLLFIAQLSTNDREAQLEAAALKAAILKSNSTKTYVSGETRPSPSSSFNSVVPNVIASNQEINVDNEQNVSYINGRPHYESYLSSVLQRRNSLAVGPNQGNPIDDFHLPAEDRGNSSLLSASKWWNTSTRDSGHFVTVTNYIRAMKSFNYNDTITLSTQATTEFLHHTIELCKRWDGPISVSVYTPNIEFMIATTLIKFMRLCLPTPLSACVQDKVTWHIVYDRAYGPQSGDLNFPKSHLDIKNYPLFVDQDRCPKFIGPEASDLIKQFEEDLRKKNGVFPKTYREQNRLTYPINVMRNTARLAAPTKYILASDIELYPSINLVSSFRRFLLEHNIKQEYGYVKKYAFTLPIFEVRSNTTAPKTKRELIKMMQEGNAIFFHKWVCDACQNFPNRLDWLQTDKYGLEDYKANDDELVIFTITQRDKSHDSWEPIFIGTNDDPLYDDRLTWDGRRDKMAQMYEMCLQDYYLFVLGNAFLVHAPGIKHMDKSDTMKRLQFIRENNAIYDANIKKLKQQYEDSANLSKC